MPLIYITGTSGSGKSAIQSELKKRGYDARDLDDPAISGAYDNKTGERVKVPDADKRPSAWFSTHSWRTHPGAIDKLRQDAESNLIFLCGVSTGEVEKFHLYDRIIYLDIDEDTLRHRVINRNDNNDYGKSENELNQILEWHTHSASKYKKIGAEFVDATKPLNYVVDSILSFVAVS